MPMSVQISAATNIVLGGDRHVHGFLDAAFGGRQHNAPGLQLIGRSRAFSSFLLLVGKLSSAGTLSASHGCILSNKQELSLPLELNMIPTAKEFADAIESVRCRSNMSSNRSHCSTTSTGGALEKKGSAVHTALQGHAQYQRVDARGPALRCVPV